MHSYKHNGDEGYTDMLGGERARKDDPVLDLIGDVDELSAWIGIVRSEGLPSQLYEELQKIQDHLSLHMAWLSSIRTDQLIDGEKLRDSLQELENWVRSIEQNLEMPTTFLLAGGSKLGALFNLLRTISRRVERKAAAQLMDDEKLRNYCLPYFNRLSTLFYYLWLKAEQNEESS